MIPSFAPAKWYISDAVHHHLVLRDGEWVNSREQDPTWYDTEVQAREVLKDLDDTIFTPLAHRVPWGNKQAEEAGKVGR